MASKPSIACPISNDPDGVAKSISEAPPTHCTVKIQSFSLLQKNSVEKYESGDFDAGGYKWKLILCPSGNKSKNIKEHVSLYLAIADTSSLCLGWEVYAVFRLFLLDQSNDNYMVLQDASVKERRFHGLKLQWGFDQFIHLKEFNDPSNGYLVDDECVFGAEVNVVKEKCSGRGECLSMMKEATSSKHVWRIDNFSKLDSEYYDSRIFSAGEQKWKMQLYPRGKRIGMGTHLSLFLALGDSTTFSRGSKVYAEFTIRILDQVQARHVSGKGNYWFSASSQESGWSKYISLPYFMLPSSGFLVKDSCLVEAEVTVLGIAKPLQ
ncbi:MATH domain and coiled-coil domain-containing protein At3g58400 isoform X2 [Tripterygium wilfordii]|uniref:MATH domain and coiled-coil domain-containing protein At3g58400 isoform X2 n=1 Tax=Tripterygium wilfordii TaxID=458696 RepID=UPI0018F7F839|nr:MATH domain and coiled-coil domain-containing protein At3g58400 isoform X2 [Tripterygium wilfordii]